MWVTPAEGKGRALARRIPSEGRAWRTARVARHAWPADGEDGEAGLSAGRCRRRSATGRGRDNVSAEYGRGLSEHTEVGIHVPSSPKRNCVLLPFP